MNCKVCNSPITEGQSFCSYCGTKIEAPAEEAVAATEAQVIPEQETKAEETATEAVAEETPAEEACETEATAEPAAEKVEETEAPTDLAETLPVTSEEDEALDKNAMTGFILGILANVITCAGIPLGIIGLVKSTRGLKAPHKRVFGIIGTILSAAGIASFFTSILSFISAFQSGMDLFEMMDMIVSNIPW